MALSHNFSTQLSDPDKLKELAAQAGFLQTRGPQKGQGSIRRLLEALIQGRAVIIQPVAQSNLDEAEHQDLVLQRQLLAEGLISEIKPLRNASLSPFAPIEVEGEPLSQMILRERR